MADLTTVYHPTIPDNSREVDTDSLEAWVEQGWLKSEPKSEAVKATRRAAATAAKKAAAAASKAEDVTPGVTDIPAIDPNVHSAPAE